MIRLTIKTIPPSLNQHQRSHWAEKKRLRQNYQWELTQQFMAQAAPFPNPESRMHVRISIYRKRLLDPDNLCVKSLLDAMRDVKLIRDDSLKWITLKVEQFKDIDNPRVEIELEEE